jgi:glycosyltransferase involved in cell wall biosynthesis
VKIYDEEETLIQDASKPASGDKPELSIFLPVYNEEPNLSPLHAKLDEALKALGRTAEIIYVDDGSTDNSLKVLREIARLENRRDGRRNRCREWRSADSDGRRHAKRSRGHHPVA